jgi:FtsP/CotA-like multicopper oxidase with cupredoxin domain
VIRILVLAIVLAACERSVTPPDPASEVALAYPVEASPNGTVRSFEITAAPTELPLIDGGTLRVWAYNGTVPGPSLRIKLGETLRVTFTNKLPQETTIHWHGVRVPNGMDGVPHMTQPPVHPGGTFTYEFTPKDAGTFWFHPHVRSSEQVERGLYGLLIVEDVSPPPFTRDVAWILDDWLIGGDRQLVEKFNTPHDLMHDGRWGNAITVNGRIDTKLEVAAGERFRLRLLNASNGRMYAPELPGLDAKIIAVDGLYTAMPLLLERFELAPGNRVDLDVIVTGGARSIEVIDSFYPSRTNRLAQIDVDGTVTTPAFPSPAKTRVPTWPNVLDTPVFHDFRLNVRRGGALGLEWTIDNVAFAGHDKHEHPALDLVRGELTHLKFTNESARLHPIHLHGMFFKLLARNGTPATEPFFRDTVLVHANESIDIAVVPLDVGDWMMHCHILEHAEAGMMTTILVQD